MLRPVRRANLSDQVFRQLRDEILTGVHRPGERLPAERELCDLLGVNRSPLREAIKRLEQARLVEVRHGAGVVVLDVLASAGLDSLQALLEPGGHIDPIVARSVLELRSLIGPETARLAAHRATEEQLDALEARAGELAVAASGPLEIFQTLDFEFHYAMAQACGNLALLLILNTARDLYADQKRHFARMFAPVAERAELYRAIVDALRARDPVRARALCAEMMALGNRVFSGLGALLAEP